MKQTSVEWFFNALIENQDKTYKQIELILEQAKAMEKEQIIDAFEHVDFNLDDGLHYYNETFKSKQDGKK